MKQTSLFEPSTIPNQYIGFEQLGPWQDAFGKKIRAFAKNSLPPIKTLSLFSGAGGLDIGFHDAGFDVVSAVEIESAFAASLEQNIGVNKYFESETNVHCVDIKDYTPDLESVDFIIGGPPCQTFSAAGARAMGVAGTKDERGNLFLEYVRLLKKLSPRGFLFENVYRIIGANKGKDWQRIQEAFSEAGYNLFYRILDTADYGVPQHRERLIIVGIRKDIAKWFLFPAPTHGPDSKANLPHYASGKALHGISEKPRKVGLNGRYGHLLNDIPPGLNYSFFTQEMGHPNPIFSWRSKFSDFLYKADPEKPVRTIKAQGGQYTGPFHWDNRPFSVNELKRLQTFPDNYEILGGRGAAIHQIGNSVPPQFARILALSVIEQVFERGIPVTLDYLPNNKELTFRKRKRALTEHYKHIAQKAIAELEPVEEDYENKEIRFNITEGFGVTKCSKGTYNAQSTFLEKKWSIRLGHAGKKNAKLAFAIKITPNKSWVLPVNEVELLSFAKGEEAYLAAWKAFDFLLQNYGFKADTVQLCGYYQYAPAFKAMLQIHDVKSFSDSDLSNALSAVCNGMIIRASYNADDLAKQLEVPLSDLPKILIKLKNLGYEVRSSGTNLAIDDNTYLIPYSFPTLTPQSVQLRKQL
jgi:DNA (cytosine-5)-methyltransferase 1